MKNKLIYTLLAFFLVVISCEEKEENPEINTTSITAMSASRYYVKASIINKGNIPILDYGFIYYVGNSEYTQVMGIENKFSLGKTIKADTFSTQIEIQNNYYSSGQKIYARAYITNEKGTVYAKPVATEIIRLQVSNIIPNHSKTGDTVTINGTNFDLLPSNNIVTFSNITAKVVSSTSTTLKVIVPNINQSYESSITVRIGAGSQTVELYSSFNLDPSVISFTPNHGTWNTSLVINGYGLSGASIYLNDISCYSYNSYSNSVSVNIPNNINEKTFKVYISKNGQKTEVPGGVFTMDKIEVSSFNPQKCIQGTTFYVNGNNFNPTTEKNKLYLGNHVVSAEYNYNVLKFTIPSTIPKGIYNAYVSNDIDTSHISGEIEIVKPVITGITPTSGYPNTKFTISGTNLSNTNSYIYFDNQSIWASYQDSVSIKGTVPNINPGTYTIYTYIGNTQIKCPDDFIILAPTLTSISPATGAANTSVIINGDGFGTYASNVYVFFGSIQAYPMSVNNKQINVKVPVGITSGSWVVSVSANGYSIPETLTFVVP